MKKILLDADASIKLTKISIIETITSSFQVILTNEVYKEQVTAGLKRNLNDAKRMEKMVSDGKVTVVEVDGNSSKSYLTMKLSLKFLIVMRSLSLQ